MPTYKITGPDGKTYKVTGEGTKAEALARLKKNLNIPSSGTLKPVESGLGDQVFDAAKAAGLPAARLRSDIGGLGAAARGAIDGATFGLADMAKAGFETATGDRPFDENLASERAETEFIRETNPKAFAAGNIGGAVAPGVGLLKAGVTATRLVPPMMTGIKGATARGTAHAADGAALGAAQALGHGEDPTLPAAAGAVAGPVGQLAVAGGRTLARPFAAMVAPEQATNRVLAKAVQRSGKSPGNLVGDLDAATRAGQPEFALADAMGNPGQRLLSTVVRTPNDARADVVEQLAQRQAGQGDRLTRALSEGFDAPDTAAQRAAALKTQRGTEADQLFEAARNDTAPVDIRGAIQAVDDFTRPGIQQSASVTSDLTDDSVSNLMNRFRARMTSGDEVLTDFEAVRQLRGEVGDAIGKAVRAGENNKARILGQLNRELDSALEASSPSYRAANDTFARRSRAIDAIDEGTRATSGRVRSDDSIQRFQALEPEAQDAFRAGFSDPLIARVQNAPFGTNKARPLMSNKTVAEFPTFAAPGRAGQLGQRISRENRMFETNALATGGSKTADNLADEAALNALDPSIIGPLLQGRPVAAGLNAATRGAAGLTGMPAGVRERLGNALMTASPAEADVIIQRALTQAARSQGVDAALVRALVAGAGAGGTQLNP